MNFSLILLITIVAVCYAKPLDSSKDAKIQSYENEVGDNGMYRFSFQSSDGTIRQESGSFQYKDNKEILVVRGLYSFLDDKGEQHIVSYVADDLGYRAEVKNNFDRPVLSASGRTKDRVGDDVQGTFAGGGVYDTENENDNENEK